MSLVLAAIYLPPLIWAAPTPNLTALHNTIAPAWVDEPRARGTWGLLYSCSFTLLLCVYTAIHLNVPGFYDTTPKIWRRKAKWVAIAIFGPEIVVFVAFEQWFYARKFLKKLKTIAEDSTDEKIRNWYTKDPKKSPLDMVYAHYVLMGGLAVNVEEIHNTFKVVTFTTDGVLWLARHGHFCQISREEIEDKSKADVLAKSLVCIQVLWVMGQAIERKAAGYPTSLLEIHTMVHVVCALVMYALWFQKPLNVQKPTALDLGNDLDLVAFCLEIGLEDGRLDPVDEQPSSLQLGYTAQRSQEIVEDPPLNECLDSLLTFRPPFVWYRQAEPVNDAASVLGGGPKMPGPPSTNAIPIITRCGLDPSVRLHFQGNSSIIYVPANQDVACTLRSGQSLECKIGLDFFATSYNEFTSTTVSISHKDFRRLNLVSKFVQRIQDLHASDVGIRSKTRWNVPPESAPIGLRSVDHDYDRSLCYRARSTQLDSLDAIRGKKLYLAGALALIPIAYGCVHLGALSMIFPTALEMLLWKLACFYLIGTAALSGIIVLLGYLDYMAGQVVESQIRKLAIDQSDRRPTLRELEDLRSREHNVTYKRYVFMAFWIWISDPQFPYMARPLGVLNMRFKKFFKFVTIKHSVYGVCHSVFVWSVKITTASLVLVYFAARIYLVIESFISLRHVPIGVYQSPSLNFFGNIPHI